MTSFCCIPLPDISRFRRTSTTFSERTLLPSHTATQTFNHSRMSYDAGEAALESPPPYTEQSTLRERGRKLYTTLKNSLGQHFKRFGERISNPSGTYVDLETLEAERHLNERRPLDRSNTRKRDDHHLLKPLPATIERPPTSYAFHVNKLRQNPFGDAEYSF